MARTLPVLSGPNLEAALRGGFRLHPRIAPEMQAFFLPEDGAIAEGRYARFDFRG